MLSELEEALLTHTEKLSRVAERLLQQARADGDLLRDLHELLDQIATDPMFPRLDPKLQQVTHGARDALAAYLGRSAPTRNLPIARGPMPKRYNV